MDPDLDPDQSQNLTKLFFVRRFAAPQNFISIHQQLSVYSYVMSKMSYLSNAEEMEKIHPVSTCRPGSGAVPKIN